MDKQEQKLYQDVRYALDRLNGALLISCYDDKTPLALCKDHLNELQDLATTYGLTTFLLLPCALRKIDAATYLGKGKVAELAVLAKSHQLDLVIFDDEISPSQQKNLEKLFSLPVIDRTELILEIFSKHAQTKEAKLQIELAKNRYQLPRLKRLWTHLSRQRSGGKGFLKGEGERQIEIDRRLVRKRITQLEHSLKEVKNHRQLQRQSRHRSELPSFALVGYTNVGKSTLLHALTQANVLIEDKLFATLDTKMRKFTLPNHQEILLVDTVGFIRKLPHTLSIAFRATLEEACHTDALIHIIDSNHPLAVEHAESTYQVLSELHIADKPTITLLNKIDLVTDRSTVAKFKFKYPRVIPFSATEKRGFDELFQEIIHLTQSLRTTLHLSIPQKKYGIIHEIMTQGKILYQEYKDNHILLDVEVPTSLAGRLTPFQRKHPEKGE